MRDRQGFCDFLSYQASVVINERDFSVSAPNGLEGVHTEVTVIAKSPAYLDAVKRIAYRRHDLTGLSFTVPLGQAMTRAELADRLFWRPVFKYRLVVEGRIECRFVSISGADVVDDVLPLLASGDELVMKVSESSDYFIGEFKIKIA